MIMRPLYSLWVLVLTAEPGEGHFDRFQTGTAARRCCSSSLARLVALEASAA